MTCWCLALICVACDSTKEIASHETFYYGRTVVALPVRGGSLGPAGIPTCTDVLGGENGASRAVDVSRVGGIDPRVALAVTGDGHHLYVAAGAKNRFRLGP